jgi:hypothetical protein
MMRNLKPLVLFSKEPMVEIGGERKGKGGVGHQAVLSSYYEHLLSNADESLVKAS